MRFKRLMITFGAVLSVLSSLLMAGVGGNVALAAKKGSPKPSAAELKKGQALFNMNCAACHGEKGDGNGPAGAVMNPKPRNFAKDAFKQGDHFDEVFKTISTGVPGTAMVAFGHLSEGDRKALAHWVRKLGGKK